MQEAAKHVATEVSQMELVVDIGAGHRRKMALRAMQGVAF